MEKCEFRRDLGILVIWKVNDWVDAMLTEILAPAAATKILVAVSGGVFRVSLPVSSSTSR